MESENQQKRKFELFFNYLKRNEQYKKCWNWFTEPFNKDRDFLHVLKNNPHKYDLFSLHIIMFGNPFLNQDINNRYQGYKDNLLGKGEFNLSNEIDKLKLYASIIPGKKLTADQFINLIKENLCKRDDFYIKINVNSNFSIKEITTTIRDIIKKERKIRKIQNARKRNVGLDELQRYLTVYDTRETIINGKKRTWPSVHERLYPKEEYNTNRLKLISDRKKAVRIINNSIKCDDPREFPFK